MRHPSWLAPAPPTVAIEITNRRVTVAGLGRAADRPAVEGMATESLPDGAVVPNLIGSNIADPALVAAAVTRALERAGLRSARRAALVVPDSVARVALLAFDEMPARQSDRDQLIRWQLRKAAPFPLDQAQLTYFTASTRGKALSVATVLARRDVVAEYERVASEAGVHAGLVDLASFSVMNLIIGQAGPIKGDWLLVHLASQATTLAILRGQELMFYRHRAAVEEPLRSLVHQTAMYHEDRLGGGAFTRVLLSGAGAESPEARDEVSQRLSVRAEVVDVRSTVELGNRTGGDADGLDALAAPIGVLIRERKAA